MGLAPDDRRDAHSGQRQEDATDYDSTREDGRPDGRRRVSVRCGDDRVKPLYIDGNAGLEPTHEWTERARPLKRLLDIQRGRPRRFDFDPLDRFLEAAGASYGLDERGDVHRAKALEPRGQPRRTAITEAEREVISARGMSEEKYAKLSKNFTPGRATTLED